MSDLIRNRIVVLIFSLGSLFQNLQAQCYYNKATYEGFISRDMSGWAGIIAGMESNESTFSIEKRLELINCYYGYIGFLMDSLRNKEAIKCIERGQELVTKILDRDKNNATALAYRGAFYGTMLAFSGVSQVIYAPKSNYYIKKAYEIDTENIQAVIEMANFYFRCPTVFGGDAGKAITLYRKAIALIEKDKLTEKNWLYIYIQILLGNAFEKTKEYNLAISAYRQILLIQPDFRWVDFYFLKPLESKNNSKKDGLWNLDEKRY